MVCEQQLYEESSLLSDSQSELHTNTDDEPDMTWDEFIDNRWNEYITNLEDGIKTHLAENKYFEIRNYTLFFVTIEDNGHHTVNFKMVCYPLDPRQVLMTIESFIW